MLSERGSNASMNDPQAKEDASRIFISRDKTGALLPGRRIPPGESLFSGLIQTPQEKIALRFPV
jgi:hypothetical protein